MADTSIAGLGERELILFAQGLAEAARAETLPRWRSGCAADDKSGGASFDPVTDADREGERAIRRLIEARFPDHGISGEELPERPAQGPYRWSLDPVDGTRAFVCGMPSWVTIAGLLEGERRIFGIIDAPCLDELYVGLAGRSVMLSAGREEPLAVSGCRSLAEARLSTTDPFLFRGAEAGAFERVRAQVRTVRYGQDGYAYARLAAGTIDLVVESGLKPYDYDGLVPVVRGAGGTFGDWRGGEDFSAGKVIAAASRELYEAAVEEMAAAA
jgi:myo-inositol-1(or 4)-monophosphatase